MTKRHFEAFAEYIRLAAMRDINHRTELERRYLARMVADIAVTFNPRFDRARFYRACGLGDV